MQDFRELKAWQKAHEIVLAIYRLTQEFPSDERFGLTSQLRRSAASIAANLAEGCGRGSDLDFRKFVHVAMGSASETEYHLILAGDLGWLRDVDRNDLLLRVQEVKRMMTSLMRRLNERRIPAARKPKG